MGLFPGYIVKRDLLARGVWCLATPFIDHPVGGAISSRERPRASGPTRVTATAATATIAAIARNTALRPQPSLIQRIDGIATKAPTRPAAARMPRREGR